MNIERPTSNGEWKNMKKQEVEPEEKVIAEWESKRKAATQKEITEIINYIQTPEGKKYVLPLNKEDGR